MTELNSGALEREAESIRAGIAQTAEALQDRMSPGKMVDEVMTYMKNSDGPLALDNLRRQARDNPLAVAMIGSGIAWLVFGGGVDRTRHSTHALHRDRYLPSPYREDRYTSHHGDDGGGSGFASTVGDAASGMAEKASHFAEWSRETAESATDSLRDAAGGASDRASRARHEAMDRGYAAVDEMRDMADRGRRTVMDALDREPLVLGAIGVAVGAALGAMLPHTRFEDETFGESRDELLRNAERVVDRAAESARHVGEEALQAAQTAAKEEGLALEAEVSGESEGGATDNARSDSDDAARRATTTGISGNETSFPPASESGELPPR